MGRGLAGALTAALLAVWLAAPARAEELAGPGVIDDIDREWLDGWEPVHHRFWGYHYAWHEVPMRLPWVVEASWFNGRMEPELGNAAATTVSHFFNPSGPSVVLTSVAWSFPALYPLSGGDLAEVRDQLNAIVNFGSTFGSWTAGFASMGEGQRILAIGAISSLAETFTYNDARADEETNIFFGRGSRRFTAEQYFTALKVAFTNNTQQPLGICGNLHRFVLQVAAELDFPTGVLMSGIGTQGGGHAFALIRRHNEGEWLIVDYGISALTGTVSLTKAAELYQRIAGRLSPEHHVFTHDRYRFGFLSSFGKSVVAFAGASNYGEEIRWSHPLLEPPDPEFRLTRHDDYAAVSWRPDYDPGAASRSLWPPELMDRDGATYSDYAHRPTSRLTLTAGVITADEMTRLDPSPAVAARYQTGDGFYDTGLATVTFASLAERKEDELFAVATYDHDWRVRSDSLPLHWRAGVRLRIYPQSVGLLPEEDWKTPSLSHFLTIPFAAEGPRDWFRVHAAVGFHPDSADRQRYRLMGESIGGSIRLGGRGNGGIVANVGSDRRSAWVGLELSAAGSDALALDLHLRFEASHRRDLWPDALVMLLDVTAAAFSVRYEMTHSTARHLNDWEHRLTVTVPIWPDGLDGGRRR